MRAVSQFTFLHVTTDSGLIECVPSFKKGEGNVEEARISVIVLLIIV